MSRIITISGNDEIPETPLSISGFETEGEMDLKLARQTAELEHGIAERIAGIGSPRARGVKSAVLDYSQALRVCHSPEAVAGIGAAIGKKAKQKAAAKKTAAASKKATKKAKTATKKAAKATKKTEKKAAKQVKAKAPARTGTTKRRGNFIKKAAAKIKKGGKAVLKVATAPQRLLVKGLAEVFIPKMSMFFLYLFVTNPATIASLPATVQRKRKKAAKFAKFMTGTIGMKEAHFMKLVRNGIMRQQKQTPEQLLKLYVKGSISGVGAIGVLPVLIPVIIEVVGKIASLFGKKPAADEMPGEDDVPNLSSDFADAAPKTVRKLLTHLEYKPESQKGREPATPAEEAREQRQEESATRQVEQEPADTSVDAELPTPDEEPSEDADVQATEQEEQADSFKSAGVPAAGPGPAGAPATPTTVSPLALGAGAAALLLLL